MVKERIKKVVGYISDDIAKKWLLDDCKGKAIIQSLDLYVHIAKHAKEYKSIESVNYTIEHISDVINDPDYVFYNEETKGIEYYKKLLENVSVVVQTSNKRDLYIASVYPVTEIKIDNRKNKEKEVLEKRIIDKYTYTGNF